MEKTIDVKAIDPKNTKTLKHLYEKALKNV